MVFTFLKTLKDLSFETQNLCHLDDMGVGCVHRKMVKNDRNNFEILPLFFHIFDSKWPTVYSSLMSFSTI